MTPGSSPGKERSAGDVVVLCSKPSLHVTVNGGVPVRSTAAVANGVAGSPNMRQPFAGEAIFKSAIPGSPKPAWPETVPRQFASWNHFSVRSAGAVIFRSSRVALVLKAMLSLHSPRNGGVPVKVRMARALPPVRQVTPFVEIVAVGVGAYFTLSLSPEQRASWKFLIV